MEKKLPEGWEWKKLGEIAEKIHYGYTASAVEKEIGPKLLRITDIQDNNVNWESVPFCEIDDKEKEKYLLHEGDLVFARTGATVGKSYLLEGDVPESVFASYLIRVILSNTVAKKYVYYFFQSSSYWLQIQSGKVGAGQPNVNATKLSEITLPIPPLETQQKIVSILEKAEETKKLRAQADELTQQLLQSVFLEMFGDLETNPKGWVVNGFDHFAKIDTKMIKDFTAYENKPHIGIENIEKDTGNLINYKEVGAQNLTSGKYLFTKNHIIYSKIRPNLNKVALPDFDGLCSADAYPLLVNNKYTNRYFFAYILRSKHFLDNILKLSDRTNIPKVNKDQLRSFECICPPIELQNKFAELVEHVEKTKISQQQSSIEINDLFDALMQKAFTGELVS